MYLCSLFAVQLLLTLTIYCRFFYYFFHCACHTLSLYDIYLLCFLVGIFKEALLCYVIHSPQAFKEALGEIRLCSKLEALLLEKKSINMGDTPESHFQKACIYFIIQF